MKEFPHHQFLIVDKYKQTESSSTFAVKPRSGEEQSLILKLHSGPTARASLRSVEEDLCWQRGLAHPHLFGIVSAGICGKSSFFTTRKISDVGLDLVKANTAVLKQFLDAICFLHKHARIHGRIKPSNLFIEQDGLRLADLGLMKCGEPLALDDIPFTAPEVLEGGTPTAESDYYSVGAIFYRFYAKRDPFEDSTSENLKAKYLHAKIPSIRSVSGAREPVARAIDALLQRSPRRRIAAFAELIDEFPFEPASVSKVPMIGRREVVEQLHRQIASKTRTLGVTLIEGDAGIGKSRLMEELQFKSTFCNSEVYVSVCELQAEPSLNSIVNLFRPIIEYRCLVERIEVRQLLGTYADSLAPLFEGSLEKGSGEGNNCPNERIVQNLIGLIGRLSRQEPLTCCIEDIDRSEPIIQGFLRQMCSRASELNVRLILTCRNSISLALSEEMRVLLGSYFTRMSIGHLTNSESRELVQYLEDDSQKQAQVLKRAGGNPLWLLNLARNENCLSQVAEIHAKIIEEMKGRFLKIIQVLAVLRTHVSAELLARVVEMDVDSVKEKLQWLKRIGAVHESNQTFEMHMDGLRKNIQSRLNSRAQRAIHREVYSVLKTVGGAPEESLAEHSFHGRLLNEAAEHYLSIAQSHWKRGDYVTALRAYGTLNRILRELNQSPSVDTEIEIAKCLSKTGKTKQAERIYLRLLNEAEINEDVRIRIPLLSKGKDIDRTYLDKQLNFLQDAVDSSRYRKVHPSFLLSRLSTSLVKTGNVAAATDALERAEASLECSTTKQEELDVTGARGFLLSYIGEFRAASETYRSLSLRLEKLDLTAAALTNRSLCLMHLGKIGAAIVIQKRAYRLVFKAGHLVGQFLCLGNLGEFHSKLGNFKEARGCFEQIKQRMSESGSTTGIFYKGVEAEEAILDWMEGRYEFALKRLHAALNSSALLKIARLQCLILESEVQFSMNVDMKTVDIERISNEGSWSPSPLYKVQVALLRSRTIPEVKEATAELTAALATATDASLVYEMCRLELELGARLLETNPNEAKQHAEAGGRIAKKNGYRPLEARALLLRGLCARNDKEKEHFLGQSFLLASEVGLPEIVSESAYHLGVLYQSMEQDAASREYLANSTRVASEIADQLPSRYRAKYLSSPWRKDARRRYAECLRDQPVRVPTAETGITASDHHYFRALYRISIAAESAQTVEAFLRVMLSSLGLTRDHVVVMLKSEGQTTWHSLAGAVSQELRQSVSSVAGKSGNHAQFHSQDRWIPFHGDQYSGGIYVRCRKGSQMGEDEMEFLTILGTFVGSTLDQIHNRVVSEPVATATADFHGIIGNSRAIRDLCAHIATISKSNATVLLQGETGTGKELAARAIHDLSTRARGPFIPIDCGAIAEGLIESELFGSKKGAFTGAIADRPGVFEAAQHGTLFLDEISNMSLSMQARLLRVLQEREIRRVGETRSRPIDVRLIAASNANLKQLVADGQFRQDLLFRLNVMSVDIPPLRNRREDVPVLSAHFLKQLNAANNTSKVFGSEALHPLLAYRFPGNVRELQNAVERGFFTTSGRTISTIPIEPRDENNPDEVRDWLSDLVAGRRNFWTAIHDRYKQRDIPREKVVALIDLGLRKTQGSYKDLASLLHIDQREYRRLMDFLRRNNCLLDFRPYRKVAPVS